MIGCLGRFEKVPFDVFKWDIAPCPEVQCLCEDDAQFSKRIRGVYDALKLPMRATDGSAGYDFYSPFDFCIQPGESVVIPTGVRAVIPESAVLFCVPRSGSGFKYGIKLANSVGIIDADFYNPETGSEGHILLRLMNHDHNEPVSFSAGDGFAQGIIVPYATMPEYDNEQWEIRGVKKRAGGFGSTDGADPEIFEQDDIVKKKHRFGFKRKK